MDLADGVVAASPRILMVYQPKMNTVAVASIHVPFSSEVMCIPFLCVVDLTSCKVYQTYEMSSMFDITGHEPRLDDTPHTTEQIERAISPHGTRGSLNVT